MPVSCLFCDQTFNSRCELFDHVTRHIGEKRHFCQFCPKEFVTTTERSVHIRFHTGERPHSCNHCGKTFKTAAELSTHVNQVHERSTEYPCETCGKIFYGRSILNAHKATHTGANRINCEICKKSLDSKSLDRHMRTHTGEKPYKCNICKYTSVCKIGLTRHMMTHTGRKYQKCDICGKSYASANSLRIHVQLVHKNFRNHTCKTCAKTFNRTRDLKAHEMTHTGEKPFECDICGKSFSQKGHVSEHMRVHTGEKPYKCATAKCFKSFSLRTSLTMHMKRIHQYNPPVQCSICGENVTNKYCLPVHMRKEHAEKTKNCGTSGKVHSSAKK